MDYKCSGAGTIPAGEYEAVKVSGAAKLAGDVRCTSLSASGSFGGSGSITCSGGVHFSGSTGIDGPISAGELKASGSFKCKGLRGGDLCVSGSARVDGDMEGDAIRVSGSINCSGLINADRIEIHIGGVSSAGSIGGSEISVYSENRSGGLSRILFGKNPHGAMNVEESIEGDDIFLEYVTCPTVIGRRVTVGPGCRIGSVQYSESAEISPEARVDDCRQV